MNIEKNCSYTKKGPGRMPYRKTKPPVEKTDKKENKE